jgi:PAS domain S-box-containing protein
MTDKSNHIPKPDTPSALKHDQQSLNRYNICVLFVVVFGASLISGLLMSRTAETIWLTSILILSSISIPFFLWMFKSNSKEHQSLEIDSELGIDIQSPTLEQFKYLNEVTNRASIILTTDLSGKITHANEAFCKISGYSKEELIGNNCRIINSGYHPKEFFTSMYRTIHSGDLWRGEICNRNKNGSVYWVETTIVPLTNQAGKLTGFYSLRVDITHQKETENDLNMILDALPSMVICKDERNNILRMNQASAHWFGLESNNVGIDNTIAPAKIGDPLLSHDEDLDVLAQGKPRTGIIESMLDDYGNRTTMRIDKVPIIDSSGFFSKIVTIATDITDAVEMEQRLSFAIESTKAGIWDWDIKAQTLHTNDLYFTMLGDDPLPSPIKSGHYYERMHPMDLLRIKSHIPEFIKSGDTHFHDEFRIMHADGVYRWIQSNAMVIEHNPDGTAKRIIGQHHDIDEQKRLDLAIRSALELKAGESQSETLYELCRSLAESTNTNFAGVAILKDKTDGRYAEILAGSLDGDPVDPIEYKLQGTPCDNVLKDDFCFYEQDVVNMFPDDLILAEMRAQGYAGLRLTGSSGQPIGLIMVLDTKPLRSPIDPQTALKLFGARATVELEHNQYADKLRNTVDLAESASKAKTDFIANMSHEIRTPMTAILGFTEILKEHGSELSKSSRDNAINTIRSNGEHLLSIINDILDISKIEAGKMHAEMMELDTLQLIHSIELLLAERTNGKGLGFEISIPSSIPSRIHSDPTRLRQILLNLIGNAVKFTEVGKITLRCFMSDRDNRLTFEVLDTGIGMTREQAEIVFDSFTQADTSTTRKYGGSGLGLKISTTLAKMLGGSIHVESELGFGSRFWFTIDPGDIEHCQRVGIDEYRAQSIELAPNNSTSSATQSAPLKDYRILLVEDGPDNQRLIRHHLERAGAIQVDIAENGQICLDMLFKDQCTQYDLILMDMQMPVLDGYEATRKIREHGLSIPIIALTAHALSSDREKCLQAGCDGYQAKPIKKTELFALCNKVVTESQRDQHDQDQRAA